MSVNLVVCEWSTFVFVVVDVTVASTVDWLLILAFTYLLKPNKLCISVDGWYRTVVSSALALPPLVGSWMVLIVNGSLSECIVICIYQIWIYHQNVSKKFL